MSRTFQLDPVGTHPTLPDLLVRLLEPGGDAKEGLPIVGLGGSAL